MELLASRLFKVIVFCVFCGSLFVSVLCDSSNVGTSNEYFIEQWSEQTSDVQRFAWPNHERLVDLLRSVAASSVSSQNSPSQCSKSLDTLVDGLTTYRRWAVEFSDSWAKMMPGFATGKISDFGDYDQCLSAKHAQFSGKYCLLALNIPTPPEMGESLDISESKLNSSWLEMPAFYAAGFKEPYTRIGICVPSTCENQEIERALKQLNRVNLTLNFNCETMDDDNEDNGRTQILARAALIGLVSLCVISTTLTYLEIGPSWTSHFDLTLNSSKAFKEQRPQEPGRRFAALNGLRFFVLVGTHLFHLCLFSFFWTPAINGNIFRGKLDIHWFLDEYGRNFEVGVSIQFIASGFLAYIMIHPLLVQNSGRLNFFVVIAARWLRTLPVVAGSALLVMGFPTWLGSGPLWKEGVSLFRSSCYKNWWREILGIGNLGHPIKHMCVPAAWAVGADFQLFVGFLPIMVILYNRPRLGQSILGLCVLIGVLLTGLLIVAKNLSPFTDANTSDWPRHMTESQWLHLSPHNYISVYAMGIYVGHLVVNGVVVDSSLWTIVGWTLSSIGFNAVYYVPALWREVGRTRMQEVIFGSVQRTLYSTAASWFLYRIITKDSLVSRVLCWKGFASSGRMFFSIFLGTFFYLYYDLMTERQPIDFRNYSILMRATSTAFYGTMLGYFMHLIFEAPFSILKEFLRMNLVAKEVFNELNVEELDVNCNLISAKNGKLKSN